jgi:tRNA pseudouridine synthase 9
MTSGILIMAKTAAKARAIDFNADRSSANSIDKLYLCRVRGEFPYINQIVRVDKPIETFSFQLGLTKIGGNKQCQTLFRRVTYEELKQQQDIHGKFIFDLNTENSEIIIDESLYKYSEQDQTKTSLILCRPLSGRMHQIRVHLQYLGFPIINDPLYNAPDIWGSSNGQYGQYEHTNEYVIDTFIKRHSCEYWLLSDIDNEDETINLNGKRVIEEQEEEINEDVKRIKTEEIKTIDVNDDNEVKNYIKEHCFECLNRFREPAPDELVMFLHALQYKISDVTTFMSSLPEWAQI